MGVAGGIVDPTLLNYINGTPTVDSRGTWYDITTWAARTHHCDNYPKSVACMACAMNMPPFTFSSHVVPIGTHLRVLRITMTRTRQRHLADLLCELFNNR